MVVTVPAAVARDTQLHALDIRDGGYCEMFLILYGALTARFLRTVAAAGVQVDWVETTEDTVVTIETVTVVTSVE